MTAVVPGLVAALALLIAGIVLGSSRRESLKRLVGALFRRRPASKAAPMGHYYKPYWSR